MGEVIKPELHGISENKADVRDTEGMEFTGIKNVRGEEEEHRINA